MSRKILLVYDDFSEMTRVQTDLRKVGFDVVGIIKEALLSDQLLIFNPDLVVVAGTAGKVTAFNVAIRLKDNARYFGKVMLLISSTQKPSLQELSQMRMDAIVEVPCPMSKIIGVIGRLFAMDYQALVDKYNKARIAEGLPPEDLHREKAPDRVSRFDQALKGLKINTESTTFDPAKIKKAQQNNEKLRNSPEAKKLDELKKKFVKALFKK